MRNQSSFASLAALVLATALAPVALGCASEPASIHAKRGGEKLGTNASAVQGGKADTNAAHNFAVGIATDYGGVCSGTLIAPNLVLTARHCVVPPSADDSVTCKDKFPASIPPRGLSVTVNPNLFRTREHYQAKEIITPAESAFCGNDIALVILEESIPASKATPVTPVVQFSMTDRSKIGSKVVALGYGITSPSAEDSGQRRMRQDIDIVCIPGDETKDCKGLGGLVDSEKEFVTEGWVCSGDSGSGAFDQASFQAGAPYVLGTLSRGPQTDTTCLEAIYTRTDAHREMIVDAGMKAAELGGYDAPDWVKPISGETTPGSEDGVTTDTSATEPGEGEGQTVVKKTTTTGCSAAPRAQSSGVAAFALAGLALVALGRRKRSR